MEKKSVFERKEDDMKQVALVLLSVMLVGMAIGCASISELITPAEIDQQAIVYAVGAGVADYNDYDGYGNLAKAKKLDVAVQSAYEVYDLSLRQQMEENQLTYEQIKGVVSNNLQRAAAAEERLFGEEGLLTVGLGLLGVGGLGGMIGLTRKRPGDWTKEEVEGALDQAGMESQERREQLYEVVRGVQEFMNSQDGASLFVKDLKVALEKWQSAETKRAVAEIKATI